MNSNSKKRSLSRVVKLKIGKKMYNKLLELADTLPKVPIKVDSEGKLRWSKRNHRSSIVKAYLAGGQEAVDKYVKDFIAECDRLIEYHPTLAESKTQKNGTNV